MTEEQSAAEAEAQTQQLVAEGQEVQEAQEEPKSEERMVPLKALEEERRKRQELEYQAQWMQSQMQQAQNPLQNQQAQPAEEEDEYTREIMTRMEQKFRDKMEKQYLAQNPDALSRIQQDLAPILQKKPWLAAAIQSAENRYAAAMEVINDYAPKREDDTTKRMVDNAEKPRSPAQGAVKGGSVSRLEMMSKMSPGEFGQWRDQLRKQRR
jgi:glutathione S-transferase